VFKQGRSPAVVVPPRAFEALIRALIKSGYEKNGQSLKRKNEAVSLKKSFHVGRGSARESRQNHIQVVIRGGMVCVYAHTEPDTDRTIMHTLAGLFDLASFSAGSRMLKRDLERSGFLLTSGSKPR
jgi:hypothetical protein